MVGQHPLVTRLIKGAFHQRPPQPRYAETWDVAKVTAHINSMGENVTLSINDLTLKTVALLAFTRPSRSVDLAKLSRVHCKYSPEGVTFAPIALTKQSRQGKPLTDFFFARFPENKSLCPVEAVQAYTDKTKKQVCRRDPANVFSSTNQTSKCDTKFYNNTPIVVNLFKY